MKKQIAMYLSDSPVHVGSVAERVKRHFYGDRVLPLSSRRVVAS